MTPPGWGWLPRRRPLTAPPAAGREGNRIGRHGYGKASTRPPDRVVIRPVEFRLRNGMLGGFRSQLPCMGTYTGREKVKTASPVPGRSTGSPALASIALNRIELDPDNVRSRYDTENVDRLRQAL